MNLSNSELDQLFKEFRKEEPVASFNETQKAFLTATVIAAGGVLATTSILKFFTFKQWIIMISILSTTTIGALIITMNTTPVTSEKKTEAVKTNSKEIILSPQEEEKVTKEKVKTFAVDIESLVPETMVSATNESPIQLIDDGNYHFMWILNQETSIEDLEKLRESAKDAGFDLAYTPVFQDDLLQQLSLHIKQKDDDGQETNIIISDIDLEEKSEYKVAWNIDEEGIATTISCGDDFESIKANELSVEQDLIELTDDLAELNGTREELEEMHVHSNSKCEVKLEKCEEGNKGECQEGNRRMRDALYKDGLIQDKQKHVEMNASRGKIEVNGKEIPKKLKKKYAKLIQDNFDVDVSKSSTKWDWSCLNR